VVQQNLATAGAVGGLRRWQADGSQWRLGRSGRGIGAVGAPDAGGEGRWTKRCGTDIDFSSTELYKRAAWQEGWAPRPEDVRAWRKKVGLSQEQLAALFDLGRRTIGYYEDGTLLVPRVVALAMKGYEAERGAAA
jgi:DNA-binding XRE family transcriptional regulator